MSSTTSTSYHASHAYSCIGYRCDPALYSGSAQEPQAPLIPHLACPNKAIFTGRIAVRRQVLRRVTAQQDMEKIIIETQRNICSYKKCQGIFPVMHIKQDQVFGISFERYMHRKNTQQNLIWKAKPNFLGCKLLTVQMSITLADGAISAT